MSNPATWETDYRWRRVMVPSQLLSAFLSGQTELAQITTAPPDLAVIVLTEVQPGPQGHYIFIIWSATFNPVPHGPNLPYGPLPMADFEYHV